MSTTAQCTAVATSWEAGMGESIDGFRLSGLGWTQMVERSWPELVSAGLPSQLASLAQELGRHRGRPVRLFTMPMLEAGVAGLALPFVDDDGILLDPSLICSEPRLGEVVAHELAYMLHPNWEDLAGDHGEMEQFASELAPMLL